MQQSLRNPKIREMFIEEIGFVGGDEIQRFAANTFQEVLNEFPAKYRLGVTANERRRDGKHKLVHDTFGKVIVDIPDVDIGSRRPAKIFMVPTRFYSDDYDESGSWTMLINELTENRKRNKLIVKCVTRSLKKKKLCLILTERKKHALWLRFYFEKRGYRTGLLIGHTSPKEIRNAKWKKSWKEFMVGFDHEKEADRVKKLGGQKKLDLIIGTQKGDVSLSIRPIDHLHVTTPTGSNLERFNQQKGRPERDYDKKLEKKFGRKKTPHVYYYWDTRMSKLQESGNKIINAYKNCDVLNLRKG